MATDAPKDDVEEPLSLEPDASLGNGPSQLPSSLSVTKLMSDQSSMDDQYPKPSDPDASKVIDKTLSELSPDNMPNIGPPMDVAFSMSADLDTDSDYSADEEDSKVDPEMTSKIKMVSVFGGADSVRRERCNATITNTNDEWVEKRKYLEKELLETEKSYCFNLNILCNCILADIFSKGLLDAAKYRKPVESTLPQICDFHNKHFLPQLMKDDAVKVFVEFSDYFKLYKSYAAGYNQMLCVLAVPFLCDYPIEIPLRCDDILTL